MVFSSLVLLIKWMRSRVLKANTSWYCFFYLFSFSILLLDFDFFYKIRFVFLFCFFFIRLSQFYDLTREFGGLMWAHTFFFAFHYSFFFWFLLCGWFFFNFILQYLICWELSFMIFFIFDAFGEMVQVTGFISKQWFLFKKKIGFCYLLHFPFYRVTWSHNLTPWVWWVDLGEFEPFFFIIAIFLYLFVWLFFQFYLSTFD